MEMDILWYKIREDNDGRVKEICTNKLKELYEKKMQGKIRRQEYLKAGEHQSYKIHFITLKTEYFRVLRDFDEDEV